MFYIIYNMARKHNDIVLSPLEDGNQKYAIRSNADIVCFTGNTGGGKSYALYYAPIEYLATNDNAKIVIDEMIQNNREQMTHWKNDCGMYKLLECQNNALLKALESIGQTEIKESD